jgi:hypothetical protein
MAGKLIKRVFGTCGTCGKPNDPRHTCSMKFSPTNAARLDARQAKKNKRK